MPWAPDYVTAAELADFLHIHDHQDDTPLGLAVAAASRAVDRECRRQFGKVDAPEERWYHPSYDYSARQWWCRVDDLHTTTGLAVAVDSAGDDSYTEQVDTIILRPMNAEAHGRPWTSIVFPRSGPTPTTTGYEQVSVTGAWGWAEVPDTVKQATLLQASRFFARRNAPFGIAGSPDSGSEMRLLAKLDPDVVAMLASFRRIGPVG